MVTFVYIILFTDLLNLECRSYVYNLIDISDISDKIYTIIIVTIEENMLSGHSISILGKFR